jgi:hypothetical protein
MSADQSAPAGDHRWNLLQLRANEARVAEAFRLFRNENIEPVLIKGWSAARLYPVEKPRVFVDTDLAVPPPPIDSPPPVASNAAAKNILVDLHRGLRHYDPRGWDAVFSETVLIECAGELVRVLDPEANLRMLSAHWLNDGGADRERLWDIYYAVKNVPDGFDWDRCVDGAGSERRSWVVYAIALAHEYFGLEIETLPFRDDVERLPQWIRTAVEKEWASNLRLRDLRLCLNDPSMLIAQIRKRLPPNPIQATIEMGASLDDSRQAYFQARTLLRRAVFSASKIRHRFTRERRVGSE